MASIEGTAGAADIPPPAKIQVTSGGGFARRSSGLVRDFSILDSWMYNTIAINVVVAGALTFGLIPFLYPQANLPLAFLIAGAFCVFEAIAYALLTAVMPRSGGDYIFQSRVLGGGVGVVFGFTLTALVQVLYMALSGSVLATIILGPFFSMLGASYDAAWMTDVGDWLVTKTGIFACGVTIGLIAAVINARGLRALARVQRVTFWTGLTILGVFIVVLLLSSKADFTANLNSFLSANYGVQDAYQATIAAAEPVSFSFSFGDTLFAAVVAGFLLIYPAWGVQQAGEIKRANSVRSNMKAMVGAELVSVALLVILALLLQSRVGREFMYASGTLFNSGAENNPLPIPPFLGFFFAIAGNAAIFIWLALIMFLCWFVVFFSNATVAATRNAMAMSFDQVLPAWLGQVNRRFHVPLNAIITFTLLTIPAAALYALIDDAAAYTLSLYLLAIVGFGVTMIAGVLLPFTRRSLYEASPAARYKVGGLPLLSISAGIFFVYALFSTITVLTRDELGVNQTKGLVFVGALWAISLIIYVTARIVRSRQHVDLSMSYRELPVE